MNNFEREFRLLGLDRERLQAMAQRRILLKLAEGGEKISDAVGPEPDNELEDLRSDVLKLHLSSEMGA